MNDIMNDILPIGRIPLTVPLDLSDSETTNPLSWLHLLPTKLPVHVEAVPLMALPHGEFDVRLSVTDDQATQFAGSLRHLPVDVATHLQDQHKQLFAQTLYRLLSKEPLQGHVESLGPTEGHSSVGYLEWGQLYNLVARLRHHVTMMSPSSTLITASERDDSKYILEHQHYRRSYTWNSPQDVQMEMKWRPLSLGNNVFCWRIIRRDLGCDVCVPLSTGDYELCISWVPLIRSETQSNTG